MHRRPLVVVAILGAVGVLAACSLLQTERFSEAQISIDASIHPRMSAQAVADIAVKDIQDREAALGVVAAPLRIVFIAAVPGNRVGEVLPQLAGDVQARGRPIVWAVGAEGTFGPDAPRALGPPVATSGWYLITDDSGAIFESGWPLQAAPPPDDPSPSPF